MSSKTLTAISTVWRKYKKEQAGCRWFESNPRELRRIQQTFQNNNRLNCKCLEKAS